MKILQNARYQVRTLLRSWFIEEQPGLPYADGTPPLSLREQRRLVRRHRLVDLLPYEQWDPESGLFINADGSRGFILEAVPPTGLAPSALNVLSGLFNVGLPPETLVQIMLYASPDIQPLLDHWRTLRGEGVYGRLAEQRLARLAPGNWESLLDDHPMPLRDFRLFVSLLRPAGFEEEAAAKELLRRWRNAFVGILESAGIICKPLDATGLINLLDTLLNPRAGRRPRLRWERRRALREQLGDGETSLHVGREGLTLSRAGLQLSVCPYSVRQYPESWAGWQSADFIGDLFSNSLRLPCPFLYTLNVSVPDQSAAQSRAQLKALRATQMADSPIGRLLPAWGERRTDWRFVNRMTESGHRLLSAQHQFLLFAPCAQAEFAEQRLNALFESRGWLLRRDRFIALHAFLSALPLSWVESLGRESQVLSRFRTMLTWSVVNTAPWIAEWKGTGTPLLLLAGRRGQVMALDPFDNDQGNFNCAVAAASGAGKSFFTQELLVSLLGSGGRAWVIDSGRSYERIGRLAGGTYLDFDSAANINLNPFAYMREEATDLPMLKALLARMAAGRQPLNSLQLAHLERALQATWRAYGRDAGVSAVADHLAASKDESARRVGSMLYPFTRSGSYGRWFDGPVGLSLDNDLVVLELGGLDDKPELQGVVLLLLMLCINQEMCHGDRARRKLCIIDEAWRLMAGGDAGRFIETGYRTARKFGGAYMTITQGIDDYYRSPTAQAALYNSDWLFLMRQRPESLRAAGEEGRLHLDENLLRLLSSLETRQGKYSEIAVMAPGGGVAMGRLLVDPFSEKLYTTRAEEYAALERLRREGYGLVDAIKKLLEEKAR